MEVNLPDSLGPRLELDFGRFLGGQGVPGYRLELHLGPLPPLPAGLNERFRGPHFVVFGSADQRYVSYPHQGWLSWNGPRVDLYAEDAECGYARLVLTIQSRLGDLLEQRGLYRVHALGLQGGLVLRPPGGGKSTLAWELLQSGQGERLLSEDTPLVDGGGRLHSFPFRLGVRQPPCGQKRLVPFPSQSSLGGPARQLVLGAWTTEAEPRVQPLGRWQGLMPLLRDCLLGYGVPQLIELYWPLSANQRLQRASLSARRLGAIARLLAGCRVSRLWLCPDPRANLECLLELIDRP